MKVLGCGTTTTLLVVPILFATFGSTLAYSLVPLHQRQGCRSPNKLASTAPSSTSDGGETDIQNYSRRDVIRRILAGGTSRVMMMTALTMTSHPLPASAAPDCFKDCMKNCKEIAPKDPDYCTANCKDYCEQDDRKDGLSGSLSAESGEVGILGGTFGQGTVPKGEDKPPSIKLPGLDFSSESGKKLIGY